MILMMRKAIWRMIAAFWLMQSITSCAASDTKDLSKLQGYWALETIEGRSVGKDVEIYFKISGKTFTGYDGCNGFIGSLEDPSRILQGQKGCGPGTLMLPLKLHDPWPQLEATRITGDVLAMPLPDGKGEAVFSRK